MVIYEHLSCLLIKFHRGLNMRLNVPSGIIFCSLVFIIAVCGGDGRLGVEGQVTFQGKLLPDGTIEFQPLDFATGGSAAGSTIKDGKYSFKAEQGLFPGKYKVLISSADSSKMMKPSGPPGPDSSRMVALERIPEDFNIKTKLIVEVEKGKTKHDFTIPK